jgi:hypothetical protein
MVESSKVEWVTRDNLFPEAAKLIRPVDVVLDIGPGILPQTYFEAQHHILCEPFPEYVETLKQRFQDSPQYTILPMTGQAALSGMSRKSVDSIFLLDVLEHLEKEDGLQLLAECERVARQQIIIFTPLGFMAQNYQSGDTDGWGMHGGEWQMHRSGWIPDDFDHSWNIVACQQFHTVNGKGEPFDPPFGAFWAIWDMRQAFNHYAQQIAATLPLPEETRIVWAGLLNDLLTSLDKQIEMDALKNNEQTIKYEQRILQLEQQVNLLQLQNAAVQKRVSFLERLWVVRGESKLRRMFPKKTIPGAK